MLTPIAEIFRNARGVGGTLHTQQGRHIRRGGNHHRPGAPFGTEDVLDKIFYFTATLANQPHHNDVGLGVASHHSEQDRFPDAGASKQTHTLAATHGQQGVDRAYTGIQHMLDRRSL